MSEEHINPFPPPIDDLGLERWTVQFQYAGKVVIGPIERTEFGAILARLRCAEGELRLAKGACEQLIEVGNMLVKERDEARRWYCDGEAGQEGSPETPREVAEEHWPGEGDRLFPKKETP